jgi:uncharacterized protein
MKIQIGRLSEGIHLYHFQLGPSELELGENFRKEVGVDATLEKLATQFFLKAEIETAGTFECDRCLSEFEAPLSGSYRMYYVVEEGGHENTDPAEIQIIPPGSSVIDISDDVRQTILLSVPLKLLCSERCEGLCPQCGRNLNTDPCSCSDTITDSRWEKLRLMQNKNL